MKLLPVLILITALPAAAQDLPQGLQSARLMPGWMTEDGQRTAALELVLEPGWKTYWRSPGDAGLPPEFDWKGSNIGKVTFHWPAPEVIVSDGIRTLGYHDRLVLPFTVEPEQGGEPIGISADVTFGLCENICIPASLELFAPAAGAVPDPAIQAAMDAAPALVNRKPACEIGEIEDGMSVTLSTPEPGAELAVEYGGAPDIWVSAPEFNAERSEVTVDLVAPGGKPFPVDPAAVVLTVLGQDGATEFRGCAAG
ncbi:protein-disulfide reductase DsbD domain-containing protein [Paracoccus albus]|uniref:protein-disulfide reductase DsbD domain-containing protein n=1 Tax=Paracoccus albus TaxID=3017784 RepID=UPI0022F069C3|nr:protein-disulfide reductase DsbD domain-containing protein [Paracoccus albus]WBU60243.1 protein-disulfide reductase DsbD family protein [Paracoccus albus]